MPIPAFVNVNASQPQDTPAGRLVCTMFYSGFLGKVLSRTEYSGYPDNGGEHTLYQTAPSAPSKRAKARLGGR